MNRKEVKCIIWDLDNTIWEGTLAESENVRLKNGIQDILLELDRRGILNSIASKNNYDDAMKKLREFDIDSLFLYPQIIWSAKSESVKRIVNKLNITADSVVFIDDQEFELEEVGSYSDQIQCIHANLYSEILDMERFNPRFITRDSSTRRTMYLQDIRREEEEQHYEGPKESFMVGLDMQFIIAEAKEEDLQRAAELTVRTNQLNSTGIIYSYDELEQLRSSGKHKLLICELTDKYGSYGKIGLALVAIDEESWHIKLLLMSCRVISRGVGTVLLNHIMRGAKMDKKILKADFRKTDRNKMMYVAYKFGNFKELPSTSSDIVFQHDLADIPDVPSYLKLIIK